MKYKMKRNIRIDSYGNKFYYVNGKLHREDGPAAEWYNGDKHWFKNDKFHRDGGPAIENINGTKIWFKNDACHREDGPAIERNNGSKTWVLNHKEFGKDNDFTNESWIRFVKTLIFS